jgi:hypothetical protein
MGSRLVVRPGLTGLAQVVGGRDISAEDKNALDIGYITCISFWLDIKIMAQTLTVLLRGERVNHHKVHAARVGLEQLTAQNPGNPDSYLFASKSVVG